MRKILINFYQDVSSVGLSSTCISDMQNTSHTITLPDSLSLTLKYYVW